MEIIYNDSSIIVCVKPAGVLSTDEAGGVPEILRRQLGEDSIKTVHRLDRVAGGLIVLAKGREAASALSEQVRSGAFKKEYMAVVHGRTLPEGRMCDLMYRDRARKMSFVTQCPGKGVQEARLGYFTLSYVPERELSLVRIQLETGRTHQIRCQFAAHGFPLAGERKYNSGDGVESLALWSCALSFCHPASGERLEYRLSPPEEPPWTFFHA